MWGIESDVHLFAVRLDTLPERTHATLTRRPGRFPPVRRDVAFFVPESITHRDVVTLLRNAGGDWLSNVEVFDVYAGPGTPPGMKSLAFALEFQHPERTLAEAEIQGAQDRMSGAVTETTGGRLRER